MIKPSKPMLTDTIQNSIKNVLISIGASTTVYLVMIIGSPREQFLINASLRRVVLGLSSAAPTTTTFNVPLQLLPHFRFFLIGRKRNLLDFHLSANQETNKTFTKKNFKPAVLHAEVVP
jgi:hypothetical protein